MLNEALAEYTMEQAIEILERNKVPCGRVNDIKSLFEGKTAKELELVTTVEGKRFVRSPIRASEKIISDIEVPPKIDENGEDLLEGLGFSTQ